MARKDANKGKAAAAAMRRQTALKYSIARMPYREIGQRLGISHTQARRDVEHALKEVREETQETALELIRLERELLDMATTPLIPRVLQGDIPAINAVRKLSESRRKLLGLDAPEKVAHTEPDGSPRRSDLAHLSLSEVRTLAAIVEKMETREGAPEPSGTKANEEEAE